MPETAKSSDKTIYKKKSFEMYTVLIASYHNGYYNMLSSNKRCMKTISETMLHDEERVSEQKIYHKM